MAHIATCMAGAEPNLMSKPCPNITVSSTPVANAMSLRSEECKDQQRNYHFFPRDKPLPPIIRSGEAESEKPSTQPQTSGSDGIDKLWTTTMRLKLNHHNLIRRRKVSVPELGPMTTVQEVTMDSPTIPGRPPLHERSISAPEGPSQGSMMFGRNPASFTEDMSRAIDDAFELTTTKEESLPSPRRLPPLLIPKFFSPPPKLGSKRSFPHLRSGSSPSLEISRPICIDTSPSVSEQLPPDNTHSRSTSADVLNSANIHTPNSAPTMRSHTYTPPPWDVYNAASASCERLTSEIPSRSGGKQGHRHGMSESSNYADKGRTRDRSELPNESPTASKTSRSAKSAERKAFEELPIGWRVAEAAERFSDHDMITLHRQALGQAERFEVLKSKDVEALSKELKQLDDRTEYLRRTYTSLRAGRRNLHSRICQYLRATRVARFSHDSMLKQEEALAELDASIDDWVGKLELAENRRTRVRQKLLEHVAAAAILPIRAERPKSPSAGSLSKRHDLRDISTPPRSPTKSQSIPQTPNGPSSPQRVVAQVPTTIPEQPLKEEIAAQEDELSRTTKSATVKRPNVESIRIYAGDDLYALLTDVQNELFQLSHNTGKKPLTRPSETQRRQLERQRSHEKLTGNGPLASLSSESKTTNISATQETQNTHVSTPSASTAEKDASREDEVLLTNAVFKP